MHTQGSFIWTARSPRKRSNPTSLSSKMGSGCCSDLLGQGSSYKAGKNLSVLKKAHAFTQKISLKA